MNTKDFYYELPKELIAQDPLEKRSDSKMLVMNKKSGVIQHTTFSSIAKFFNPGDVLVLNETKVIPARLLGFIANDEAPLNASADSCIEPCSLASEVAQTRTKAKCDLSNPLLVRTENEMQHSQANEVDKTHTKAKGSLLNPLLVRTENEMQHSQANEVEYEASTYKKPAEIFLLKRLSTNTWECLVKPGKKLRAGTKVVFGDNVMTAEIKEVLDTGNRIVEFTFDGIWEEVLNKLGEVPLPPYITHKLKDANRYQTVYAKNDGSVAAPTAGLHFTNELLKELEDKGVIITKLTLHVGLGTFRPVKAENIEEHVMHSEEYFVSEETARIVNLAKMEGRRVIACGTTSVRTLESVAVSTDTNIEPCSLASEVVRTRTKAKCSPGNPLLARTDNDMPCSLASEVAQTRTKAKCSPGNPLLARTDNDMPCSLASEVAQTRTKAKCSLCNPLLVRTDKVDQHSQVKYLIKPGHGNTNIFIYPGYEFKIVDGLITNFHLPESTLVMLVSALCTRENILHAYEEAVKLKYRFFSFGDACLFI